MRIEVLTVPECPNGPLVERRLAAALSGRLDVTVERRVAGTAAQAEEYGMHGSPTVLIDGRDPFAGPETGTSLSCRLYRDERGRAQGAPSTGQLRAALAAAECCPSQAPAALAVGRGGPGTSSHWTNSGGSSWPTRSPPAPPGSRSPCRPG